MHFSQRPDEAEDRAVVGHWEGVLVLGTQPSAVASVVDRASRYLVLAALPGRHGATQLRAALGRTLAGLSPDLLRSLTWDNGKEMAQHARIATDLGMGVFFTDPHSPWQRGSNENANGLLRQYLPKGTDISDRDQRALDAIAAKLNRRPAGCWGIAAPPRCSPPPARAGSAPVSQPLLELEARCSVRYTVGRDTENTLVRSVMV